MKHTTKGLLAAAALAAAGAAHAQADTSVYGVADLSYGRFESSGQLRAHRYNSNSLTASCAAVYPMLSAALAAVPAIVPPVPKTTIFSKLSVTITCKLSKTG